MADNVNLQVTCSELRSAAQKIAQANEEYRAAAGNLQAAADEVAGMWEGDTRDKFVSGMEQRKAWYEQMSGIVDEYVQVMQQIADKYEQMDAQGAALIRKR